MTARALTHGPLAPKLVPWSTVRWVPDVDGLAGERLLTSIEQPQYRAPFSLTPWIPLGLRRTEHHTSADTSLKTPFAVVSEGPAMARVAARALTERFGGLDAVAVGTANDGASYLVHLGPVRLPGTGPDPGMANERPLMTLGIPRGLGIERRISVQWRDLHPTLDAVFVQRTSSGDVLEITRGA